MKQRVHLRRLAWVLGIALVLGALLSVALSSSTGSISRAAASSWPADLAGVQPARSSHVSASSLSSSPTSSEDPTRAVRRAWELARQVGTYRFGTELVQTSFPALTLSNVGNGPQQDELHLEGAVNLPAQSMEVQFWQGAGNVLTQGNGSEARIEDGKAFVRPAGGSWEEVTGAAADFSSSFAPGADPLAFLAGMKNVRLAPVSANPLAADAAHYAFDLDGPAFATHLRDQLEEQLRERGELPLNVSLQTSSEFREAQGEGELWVDGRGLPLRLSVHLVFAEQVNGAHVEADIKTDFSGFPERLAAGPQLMEQPLAWAGAALGLDKAASSPAAAAKTCGPVGSVAFGFGALALLVGCRRSRRLYAAVVIAVTLSMVLVPLMQSGQAAAYFERQAASTAEDAAQSSEQEAQTQALAAAIAPAWDPQQDPLAQAATGAAGASQTTAQPDAPFPTVATTTTSEPADTECDTGDTADPDGDGVNNYEECLYGTLPDQADTDSDGLDDSQELNRLGTDPTNWDTDGDFITDTVEVAGFTYAGQQWYLDPRHADTNSDGVVDSIECPALGTGEAPGANCDTDGDGVPDPFDRDNDNDGAPDLVDVSENKAMDRNGLRTGTAPAAAAFDSDHPFQLMVKNLQPNWPVLVDLQLRPITTTHLAYALNVLDWPSNDLDGQIQHAKDTTFATSDNPDLKDPLDEPGSHGDMRLVPLMELTITGNEVPLKLTDPATTVEVRGALSATVSLAQQPADHAKTDLVFEFGQAGNHDVTLYDGYCPPSGTQTPTFTGVATGAQQTYAMKLNDLADGEHALVVKQGANTACAEIGDIVTGPYTDKMVDQSVLEPYGISVKETETRALQVYLPLNVVSDDTGGGKTAFQTRMLYWPGDSNVWQEAQQVRVLWALNMLTDECDSESFATWDEYKAANPGATEEDYDAALAKHCETHRTQDKIDVVQTYDESWYLTGLSVREDHGLDVAISYPNPGKTYDDDDLWGLSWGLGQQFLPGQDCETDATLYTSGKCEAAPDALRDITIFGHDSRGKRIGNSTISQRFNITSTITGPARWDLGADSLVVEDYRYADQDYMAYLAGHETPRILGLYDTSLEPTLLFAREERYRVAGLEGAAPTTTSLATVDLDPAAHAEKILTGLQWAPYRYNPNTGPDGKVIGWEAYPGEEYWNTLSDDLRAQFKETFPNDDIETTEGRMVVARAYYMALLNGITESVELSKVRKGGSSNDALINAAKKTTTSISNVTIKVLEGAYSTYKACKVWAESPWLLMGKDLGGQAPESASVFKSIGKSALGFIAGPWAGLLKAGVPYQAAAVGLTVAAVATLVLAFALGNDTDTIGMVARVLLAVNVLITLQVAVGAIVNASKAAGGFAKMVKSSLSGFRDFGSTVKSGATKFGVAALVIQTVIVWAAFFVQWGLGHMKAGSMALDNAAASAIAATLAAVLLFVVLTALGPLGTLIKALIGVIDALVMLICNSFLTAAQQASKAGKWLCGGITGLVANIIKWRMYSGAMIVNLSPTEDQGAPWYPRVKFGAFGMDLAAPERGVVTGNSISYRIALTNTIDLASRPISPWTVTFGWQFSDKNLRKSTFDYKWQDEQAGFEDGLSLGDMSGKWLETSGGRPYVYTETVASRQPIPLPAPGLNQPLSPLYLSEAYAAPEQECWGWFPIGGCGISTEKSTVHYDIGATLLLDVLPATLDGFRQLMWQQNGRWALAWGQSGATHFPVLYDADSDGLSADADPNDSQWDTDGDGLADGYEQEYGSDPKVVDTDLDGLSDAEEARLGANPRLKDSDGDGLRDDEEVKGWEFVYGRTAAGTPLITYVYSDPNLVDGDGDTLTDKQEKTFAYNPNVPSVLNVLTLESQVTEAPATGGAGSQTPTDGFVKPGDTLYYTATVKNELDLREAEGLLSTQATPLLDASKIPQPKPYVLEALETVTATGTLGVSSAAASGAYSLTQVAGALITDWRTGSGGSSLWLRFDEDAGATSYRDTSGSQPAHDGTCVGTGCTIVTNGRYGSAIQLNGGGYVHSDTPVSASAYAVSLWFKAALDSPSGVLFTDHGNGQYRALVLLNKGVLCASVSGEEICVPNAFTDKQWHQVVHTYGGQAGNQKLYVDGRLVKSGSRVAAATTATSNANIGGSPVQVLGQGDMFSGLIDDVRLFERGAHRKRGLGHGTVAGVPHGLRETERMGGRLVVPRAGFVRRHVLSGSHRGGYPRQCGAIQRDELSERQPQPAGRPEWGQVQHLCMGLPGQRLRV